jgi:hypothetical protein
MSRLLAGGASFCPSIAVLRTPIMTGLVAIATTVVVASSAAGSESVALKAGFSAGSLGDGATATEGFTFAGNEYFGRTEPLSSLAVHLPGGIGGSSSGFATCEVSTLQITGPTGCAPGSSAGPEGALTGEVSFGTEIVPEQVKVLAFFGAGETVNLYAQGSSPVSLEFVMTASYAPDAAPYGRVLSITVPPVETVPGAPRMTITSLTLALGSSRKERGSESHSLTIPTECPVGGFDWLATAGFENATGAQATYRSSCPTGRPTSPLLGQREAIAVVSGDVTVRAKGSSSFVPLAAAGTIPDGSEIDTTDGRAVIAAATTTSGQSQSAEVYGGRSLVHQDRALGQTDLALSLPLSGCPAKSGHRGAAASTTRHRSRPRTRHLWVSEGGGNWSTTGRYVSTSVEGTSWLTHDQCTNSRVTVASGKVKVDDLILNRSRTLSAGETYTARRRHSKRHR